MSLGENMLSCVVEQENAGLLHQLAAALLSLIMSVLIFKKYSTRFSFFLSGGFCNFFFFFLKDKTDYPSQ